VVPAGSLVNKAKALAQIAQISAGGSTDLSSGYLRGLQELKRVAGPSGGTLLLISDGHVNQGISDPAALGDIARQANGKGLTTSTLGYGLGYDETLLTAITRGGSGNHHFAQDPDAAGAAIASEVTDLLSKSVLAVSLTVQCGPAVEMVRLYNDLPSTEIGAGQVMIELGDFYAEEERKVLLKLKVPAMAALGLTQVAKLELRYVELPGLLEHVVTMPINVNVVPGDQAAGRVVDPTVRTEVVYQEAQQSKRLASESLERGDRATAKKLLRQAVKKLDSAGAFVPEELRSDLESEISEMTDVRRHMDLLSTEYTSKMTRASYHDKNRKRGRRPTE
jgi:Ca-activated chloride channel family protein